MYLTNCQNKQTLHIHNFFRITHYFPKTGAEISLKENLEYESILYNFNNYRLTRYPENLKIKLYYFQEFKELKYSI